jgi:hypothetical protein
MRGRIKTVLQPARAAEAGEVKQIGKQARLCNRPAVAFRKMGGRWTDAGKGVAFRVYILGFAFSAIARRQPGIEIRAGPHNVTPIRQIRWRDLFASCLQPATRAFTGNNC